MAEPLRLSGRLDLAAVDALHRALLAAPPGDLRLDLSQVSRIGALALQCLLAAARVEGRRLLLENVPEAVREECRLLGLPPELLMEEAP